MISSFNVSRIKQKININNNHLLSIIQQTNNELKSSYLFNIDFYITPCYTLVVIYIKEIAMKDIIKYIIENPQYSLIGIFTVLSLSFVTINFILDLILTTFK